MRKPIVWIYIICFNEVLMLPYLLRHYSTFADTITFFDAGSTDGTRRILLDIKKKFPCKVNVEHFTHCTGIDDTVFRDFTNQVYKTARGKADWVMWVDSDEFIYHKDILSVLQRYKDAGINIADLEGFQMVHDRIPTTLGQIYEEVKRGIPDADYCKVNVVNPELELEWGIGRHFFHKEPDGGVRSKTRDIKLLHCRWLGDDYIISRSKTNWSRYAESNKEMGYGTQCSDLGLYKTFHRYHAAILDAPEVV